MPNYKGSLFFAVENASWSENYYGSSDTIETFLGHLDNLASERVKCCANGVKIEAIRASDDNIRGDSRVKVSEQWVSKHNLEFVPDAPWTGLLMRCEAGQFARCSRLLRGSPDRWVEGKDEDNGAAPMRNKAVNAFGDYLVKNSWAMKGVNRDPQVTRPQKIADVRIGDDDFLLLTVTGHAIPNLSKVQINWGSDTVLTPPRKNGVYTAFVKSADQITIRKVNLLQSPPQYFGNGTIQIYQRILLPFTKAYYLRPGKRDTHLSGFFGQRGRRSKAKKPA